MNQYERAMVVSSCKYVDEWFIMDSKESQQNHIIRSKPNYIVMGSDWKDKDYFTQLDINKKLLEEMSCKMLFMEYTKGVSTTEIIERLLNLNVL
jgi:glycerol-3-phosphate cytidylyltransferase-like family protein